MSFDSLPMSRHVIERKIEMLDIVYCTYTIQYSLGWFWNFNRAKLSIEELGHSNHVKSYWIIFFVLVLQKPQKIREICRAGNSLICSLLIR